MSKDTGESVPSGGTEVQPEPIVSPTTEDQQTSPEAEVTLETVLKRQETLDAQLRALQGDKDRGVNKALEGVKDLSERFEEYAQIRIKGKEPQAAQRELYLNEMIDKYAGTQVVQGETGNQAAVPSADDLDSYFQEFDINPNDPDAIEFIREGKFDPVARTKFVVARSGKQTSPPSAASSMPDGSGATISEPEVQELTARLVELQKEPLKHEEERKKIMEQLSKLTPRK